MSLEENNPDSAGGDLRELAWKVRLNCGYFNPEMRKWAKDWLAYHPEPVRGNQGKRLVVDDAWEELSECDKREE